MPWCISKGSFYLLSGFKQDPAGLVGSSPLGDYGLTGAGRGVILVLEFGPNGELDSATDASKDISPSINGRRVAIRVDMPSSGSASATIYIPDTDTDRIAAIDALLTKGYTGPYPATSVIKEIAGVTFGSPDTSTTVSVGTGSSPGTSKVTIGSWSHDF
jgi:hypothetical protein